MQKVFIADQSEDFSALLAGTLQAKYQVAVCGDGNVLLPRLRQFQPDVLILDLMMAGITSFELLRQVKQESLCSAVIITSRFISDHVLECLERVGVDYVLRKPCTIRAILDQVDELCSARSVDVAQQPDPHCVVSSMLLALNVSTHKKGFRYCRQGILMLAEDPSAQITKGIYPAIAKQCGTSSTAVEKAIRSAIDSAWENRSNDLWRQYFTPAPNGQVPKPTNTQFLTRLADVVAVSRHSFNRASGR